MNPSLKRSLKNMVWSAINHTGSFKLSLPFYQGLGSILMFHRIAHPTNSPRLHANLTIESSPEYLENLIQFCQANNYEILSLDQIHHQLNTGNFNRRFVAFTFDDGYLDNYTLAYPILKKYDVPFTVYVTTNFPNQTALLWWYLIEDIILQNNAVQFQFGEERFFASTRDQQEKNQAFDQLRDFILHRDFTCQKKLISQLGDQFNLDPLSYVRRLGMSWKNVQTLMQDPLVTIGAHTQNHVNLNALSDKEATSEILDSKLELEQKTGYPVQHFSYPFGWRNEASTREFDLARSLGFKTATTTRLGNIFAKHRNHQTALPRVAVDGTESNLNKLQLRMNGFQLAITSQLRERIVTI